MCRNNFLIRTYFCTVLKNTDAFWCILLLHLSIYWNCSCFSILVKYGFLLLFDMIQRLIPNTNSSLCWAQNCSEWDFSHLSTKISFGFLEIFENFVQFLSIWNCHKLLNAFSENQANKGDFACPIYHCRKKVKIQN